ncbi:AMP-binding protein, partial [Fangia hongkongensis]
FPGHKTLPQLFEAQVAKTPDAVAVVFNDKQLTYDELNKRSNQLANHIRSTYLVAKRDALMPDALIPLCLERSIDLVVAIIATLKAGAAYVPISPDCPQERMQYIMDDIGAVLLVTQTSLLKKVGILAPKMMNVLVDDDGCYRECSDNLPKHSKASDLAYVIYTSGTTGQPKGVMI